MNPKIIALNVVLLAIVVYAGVTFRREVQMAKARQLAIIQASVQPVSTPVVTPLSYPAPAAATAYTAVATRNLFHPSRNPDIPIEVPIVPPAPPKPMPALPAYRGAMNLAEEPVALLALGNAPTKPVQIGEQIGPFKLVDFNTVDITFEWDGQIVRRTLEHLSDHSARASVTSTVETVRIAAPAPVAAPVIPQPLGPGPMTPRGTATCLPNDSTPAGTVQNGLKKVMIPTPFATACLWEPVTTRPGGLL
jgi:hypothetical protein